MSTAAEGTTDYPEDKTDGHELALPLDVLYRSEPRD